MPPRLVLLVLAAGAGSRIGGNKALLELGGRTVLERLVAESRDSGFDELLLVSGAQAPEVEALADRLGVPWVRNEAWSSGQSGSVVTGIRRVLEQPCAGCALLPVDHVFTRRDDLLHLTRAFRGHEARSSHIFRPVHGERRGHPVLFGAELLPAFLELEGRPANRVSRERPELLQLIPVDNPHIGDDVDTPEDRERAERILRGLED